MSDIPLLEYGCRWCSTKEEIIASLTDTIRNLEERNSKLTETNAKLVDFILNPSPNDKMLSSTVFHTGQPNSVPQSTTPHAKRQRPSCTVTSETIATKRITTTSEKNPTSSAKMIKLPKCPGNESKTRIRVRRAQPWITRQCVLCGYYDITSHMARHYRNKHKGYKAYSKDTPGFPQDFYVNTEAAFKRCPPHRRPKEIDIENVQGINPEWLGKIPNSDNKESSNDGQYEKDNTVSPSTAHPNLNNT